MSQFQWVREYDNLKSVAHISFDWHNSRPHSLCGLALNGNAGKNVYNPRCDNCTKIITNMYSSATYELPTHTTETFLVTVTRPVNSSFEFAELLARKFRSHTTWHISVKPAESPKEEEDNAQS